MFWERPIKVKQKCFISISPAWLLGIKMPLECSIFLNLYQDGNVTGHLISEPGKEEALFQKGIAVADTLHVPVDGAVGCVGGDAEADSGDACGGYLS